VTERDPGLRIEPMRSEHAPAVLEIYRQGIETGDATLETAVPDWPTFDAAHLPTCRFVATTTEDGRVVGWVALAPYSSRAVYRGVAWESVYVARESWGTGVGSALLRAAVSASEERGIWTLLAGVLAENTASLALHRRLGFRRVGVNRSIARDRTGRWRDVVQLERHSTTVETRLSP
jgi:phosphinothricin acetyltransferase